MKITPKMLSIPPYISTSWQHVASIQTQNGALIITLTSGTRVTIPNLSQDVIHQIYAAHADYLDKHESHALLEQKNDKLLSHLQDLTGDSAVKFGINMGDGLGTVMQHNPEQANAPDLPSEVLERIASITKIIAPQDVQSLPKAEPHCNCMHCQLARTIRHALEGQDEGLISQENEEEVTEQDLSFCQWDIVQTGDKMYTVINRLDSKERYSVYLGHPVGCTCGKPGCDHVLAVLRN